MPETVTFFAPTVEEQVELTLAEAKVTLEYLLEEDLFEGDLDSTTFLSRVKYAQEQLTGSTPDWVWTAMEDLETLAKGAAEVGVDVLWE